jgi:hypothetical protein
MIKHTFDIYATLNMRIQISGIKSIYHRLCQEQSILPYHIVIEKKNQLTFLIRI